MKYIINEKKYDLIIKEYLDDLFSNFKISIFLKPKTSKNPLKNGIIDFKLNGKLKATVFFSNDNLINEIMIEDKIYDGIFNFFSMSNYYDIQKHLLMWFKGFNILENYNFDLLSSINTFDNEEYVY